MSKRKCHKINRMYRPPERRKHSPKKGIERNEGFSKKYI